MWSWERWRIVRGTSENQSRPSNDRPTLPSASDEIKNAPDRALYRRDSAIDKVIEELFPSPTPDSKAPEDEDEDEEESLVIVENDDDDVTWESNSSDSGEDGTVLPSIRKEELLPSMLIEASLAATHIIDFAQPTSQIPNNDASPKQLLPGHHDSQGAERHCTEEPSQDTPRPKSVSEDQFEPDASKEDTTIASKASEAPSSSHQNDQPPSTSIDSSRPANDDFKLYFDPTIWAPHDPDSFHPPGLKGVTEIRMHAHIYTNPRSSSVHMPRARRTGLLIRRQQTRRGDVPSAVFGSYIIA